MVIGKLFKRLAGDSTPATISDDPFGRDQDKAAVPPAPTFTARSERAPAVLQRDEIIDGRTRIAGYRFSARLPDDGRADPRATYAVLAEGRLATFAERRLALIPLDIADWPNFDWPALIAAHTVFLLNAPRELTPGWRETAAAIRTAGARIALAHVDPERDAALIEEFAAYVLVDFSAYSVQGLEALAQGLRQRHPTVDLLAERVASWPERRLCVAQGFACCLGDFSTQPDEADQREDISGSRLTLIEMLNQLRQDVELADLAAIAKRDPTVALQIVGMANSPIFGAGRNVTSVDQAIMLIGREQLYRWLAISMFRAEPTSPRDAALLELALARGRFLELIAAGRHGKAECDELFLVGLLSLMDSLLGMPMEKLLTRFKLSEALSEVLLRSGGPWGRYLMLAIAVEKGRAQQIASFAAMLQQPLDEIETASVAALAWAAEAASQSGA